MDSSIVKISPTRPTRLTRLTRLFFSRRLERFLSIPNLHRSLGQLRDARREIGRGVLFPGEIVAFRVDKARNNETTEVEPQAVAKTAGLVALKPRYGSFSPLPFRMRRAHFLILDSRVLDCLGAEK